MAKKIRVWDGTQWQDVAPALPYTAVHSAQASMPSTGVDGQIWLDTDGTLSDTAFVPLSTIDAKGDLLVGTSDNTVNKLTVGSNNQILIADSSQSSGITWSNTLNNSILISPEERWSVSSTSATGTVNFDAATQGVLYYTSNASGNWTLNVRGNSGTTLNSILTTGDSITIAFFATNGGTAYYQTAFQIDGSSVIPKWSGGTAPSAGNASSIDIYSFTIVKTANTTFTVFGAGPVKYA